MLSNSAALISNQFLKSKECKSEPRYPESTEDSVLFGSVADNLLSVRNCPLLELSSLLCPWLHTITLLDSYCCYWMDWATLCPPRPGRHTAGSVFKFLMACACIDIFSCMLLLRPENLLDAPQPCAAPAPAPTTVFLLCTAAFSSCNFLRSLATSPKKSEPPRMLWTIGPPWQLYFSFRCFLRSMQ